MRLRLKTAKALLGAAVCLVTISVPVSAHSSEETKKLVNDLAVLGIAHDECKLNKTKADHAAGAIIDRLMQDHGFKDEDFQREVFPLVFKMGVAYGFDRVFHDALCPRAKQILKESP